MEYASQSALVATSTAPPSTGPAEKTVASGNGMKTASDGSDGDGDCVSTVYMYGYDVDENNASPAWRQLLGPGAMLLGSKEYATHTDHVGCETFLLGCFLDGATAPIPGLLPAKPVPTHGPKRSGSTAGVTSQSQAKKASKSASLLKTPAAKKKSRCSKGEDGNEEEGNTVEVFLNNSSEKEWSFKRRRA